MEDAVTKILLKMVRLVVGRAILPRGPLWGRLLGGSFGRWANLRTRQTPAASRPQRGPQPGSAAPRSCTRVHPSLETPPHIQPPRYTSRNLHETYTRASPGRSRRLPLLRFRPHLRCQALRRNALALDRPPARRTYQIRPGHRRATEYLLHRRVQRRHLEDH